MAHARKFRFGVQFVNARSADEWQRKVREAEDLGYDTICLSDHFMEQLAPLPGLMAAAAATKKVRLGACLLDNDFRHPVVLAKEIATMDMLSGGRIELGIGAGWLESDYQTSGIPYEPPGVRVSKLEEAIRVLKGLFADGPLEFDGQHYKVRLEGHPKPLQRPHPPFFIGGGGKRMLSIAGREADIVGVNFNLKAGKYGAGMGADATTKATDQKLQWLREAAGDRYADLELNVLVYVPMVTPAPREQIAQMVGPHFDAAPDVILKMPYALIGTVDDIVTQLEERREMYDFSYFTIPESAMHAFAPVVARLAGK